MRVAHAPLSSDITHCHLTSPRIIRNRSRHVAAAATPPRQNRRFSTEFNFSPEPMFFLTVELVLNLKLNFFLSILEPFLPSS